MNGSNGVIGTADTLIRLSVKKEEASRQNFKLQVETSKM